MQFMFVCADKLPLASSGKRPLKNIPPRGEGGRPTNFTTVQKTRWNYSSVYFNIHVLRYNTELWDFSKLCCDMQSSCRLYSVTLLLPCDRLPNVEDTWSRCMSAVIQLPLSAFRWQRNAFGVSQNDFIPEPLSKTRSNRTRTKHILLACSGARVGVLVNRELRCIARMGRVTRWKAHRLYFPLNICSVIKSWGVRRKMENTCINLVCCHYQGRPICS